jgi:N-acetylglucosaminyldiphosphoundecaprenol N-acetyl-beta-D-mannosaminyltransferase
MLRAVERRVGDVSFRRVEFLGLPLDLTDDSQALHVCETIVRERVPRQVVAINANKVALFKQHRALQAVVRSSALNYIDGASLTLAGYLFGERFPKKVPGVWLAEQLIALASRKGLRPYFLGAQDWVLERAIASYRNRFPGLAVAGYRHGYFRPEDETGIVTTIRDARPEMLFVGFGSPQKELWIDRHLEALDVPLCVGVGGSFDVAAGLYTRSPRWMADLGLEWVHRVRQEPRRMWKRYLVTNLQFTGHVLRHRLMGR